MLSRKFLVNLTLLNVVVCMLAVLAVPAASTPSEPPKRKSRRTSLLDAALADARCDDRLRRLTALRVLAAIADPAARPVLAELRASGDPATATAAAHALARIAGDPGPLLALVNGGLDEGDAVAAMGDCVGPAFDDALRQLALPRDPVVRAAALRMFARRAPAQATSLVRDGLASSESVLRLRALDAALRRPDRTYEDGLRRCAESEDATERRLALGALAHAGDAGAAARLLADADRSDPWDMLFAAETAAWAELAGAGDAWLGAVRALPATDRATALARLRCEVPPALRAPLLGFLDDRREDVRTAAALALGAAGGPPARAILAAAAKSSGDPSLAADAAVALASLDR